MRTKNFLIMLFAIVLTAGISLKYLEKEYSYITLQQQTGTIFNILFASALIFYITITIPYVKKRSPQLIKNGQSFFVLAATAVLLTILNFLPLLLIENFPYDRNKAETVEVLVKDKREIRSGGGAPYFILETTSWRGSPSEKFQSSYSRFSEYAKGDILTVTLGRDFFGRIRVTSLKKL